MSRPGPTFHGDSFISNMFSNLLGPIIGRRLRISVAKHNRFHIQRESGIVIQPQRTACFSQHGAGRNKLECYSRDVELQFSILKFTGFNGMVKLTVRNDKQSLGWNVEVKKSEVGHLRRVCSRLCLVVNENLAIPQMERIAVVRVLRALSCAPRSYPPQSADQRRIVLSVFLQLRRLWGLAAATGPRASSS